MSYFHVIVSFYFSDRINQPFRVRLSGQAEKKKLNPRRFYDEKNMDNCMFFVFTQRNNDNNNGLIYEFAVQRKTSCSKLAILL